MVRIKRLFHILIIIALLFGLSSCGTKGSNSFKEVDFSNETDVLIEHNGIEYNCDLKFNGNLLNLTVCSSKGDLIVAFTVDSLTCTIAYGELKKSYETDKIYEDFLPVKLFRFFNANGTVLKFKSDEKAGTAVFDSIIGEPHIYIASDNTIIFQIN